MAQKSLDSKTEKQHQTDMENIQQQLNELERANAELVKEKDELNKEID